MATLCIFVRVLALPESLNKPLFLEEPLLKLYAAIILPLS